MGTLHSSSAPPPALYPMGDRPPVANSYFAITIDAAVDLRDALEYRGLPRAERVSRAQAEQQGFLSEFSDPGLGVAFDLRIAADPTASTPISVALLGRVWGSGADGVAARAESLRAQVHAAMPRHVAASPVADADAVTRLLAPFAGASVDSAVITRHELIGQPSRPDAGVSYYYSAGPFNRSGGDWPAVYSALAASPVPVVLSVAVLPMTVPPQFAQTLLTLANYYGRLAREGEQDGQYRGRARLAPDAFAVDAERAFHDFSRRLSRRAFALRIQVSAAKQLPPGIAEAIAGAVFPAERDGSLLEYQRAGAGGAACDVRRPGSVAERRLAEYNLNVINFGMLTGRPEIWNRQDPPDPQLAMLSVLGDAGDACCAFRFPIAADGGVPGFRVRRGQPGQAVAQAATGEAIRLGRLSGTGASGTGVSTGASGTSGEIAVPLRSLTGAALIAGSAGRGRTGTALAILRQLWADHGIPFLVIEPADAGTDGYRSLAGEPGFEALEVITAGDEEGAPLRFNPFEVPTGVLVGEHTANLLACFKAAFGLCGPLPSVYRDALNLTYLRAGFLSAERPTGIKRAWPTVVDFLAAMGEVTKGLRYAGDVMADLDAASVRRARQLVRGTAASAFMTDRPNDFGRMLDHPVVVELKSLGSGDEQPLMMALLLNAITEHCRSARGASADLVHVTLVEEAHRLLARAEGGQPGRDARAKQEAAEALANTLAENGRYGEGVIIADRRPAKLVADAVRSASLQIIHRLTAEDDRRYLGETTGLDEAQRRLAARLQAGEVLLYSDESAEATHVSIAGAPRAAATLAGTPLAGTRLSAAPLAAAPTAVTPRPGVVRPAATPFAACTHCRSQCAYRGAALSMVNDPGIVRDVTDAAGAVTRAGAGPAEQRAGLAELRGRLQDTVGRFAVLPKADPGHSDAAYCLFLHVYASSALRALPAWPDIAARLLIQAAGDLADPAGKAGAEPLGAVGEAAWGAEATGDSLLRAAGDIAGPAERADGDTSRAAEEPGGEWTDRNTTTQERPTREGDGR
jgi:hypothetical protein